ncbi:MAG: aldehyde dehydrogenase family protein, partial [Actinobacteria bacterium]|nr:aldehyde dehydrogenase family protein [Actinomycetota bacterium]
MFSIINPANEEVVTTVAPSSLEEVDEAIARSNEALASWRDVAPGDRANMLRRFSDVVRDHVEELAQLEVINAGHTIGNARWEA